MNVMAVMHYTGFCTSSQDLGCIASKNQFKFKLHIVLIFCAHCIWRFLFCHRWMNNNLETPGT